MHQHNEKCCSKHQYCNIDSPCMNSSYDNMPLAMAYVPWQKFQNVYSLQDGCFFNGTIFKELDKPFLGRRI